MKFNVNYEVTIYPTEEGWLKISKNLQNMYSIKMANDILVRNTTEDGGYKDILWSIINDHNDLFYHGTDCLKTTIIDLDESEMDKIE